MADSKRVYRDKTGWPLPPEKTGVGSVYNAKADDVWDLVENFDQARRHRNCMAVSSQISSEKNKRRRLDKVKCIQTTAMSEALNWWEEKCTARGGFKGLCGKGTIARCAADVGCSLATAKAAKRRMIASFGGRKGGKWSPNA
jgi:hypothetical protein